MSNIRILSIFSLLLISSSTFSTTEAAVMDFCVADTSLPDGPAGYSCKKPDKVVADDFFFSLSAKGSTSNIFGVGLTFGTSPKFAGVNGLGISIAQVDIAKGGVVPMHTHPGATELAIVIEGEVVAGFISSDANKVYIKTLKKGELMVFPRGLLHFQVNIGHSDALIYASFSDDRPGLQVTSEALFGNNLPSDILQKTTLISPVEILRLKRLFRGTY